VRLSRPCKPNEIKKHLNFLTMAHKQGFSIPVSDVATNDQSAMQLVSYLTQMNVCDGRFAAVDQNTASQAFQHFAKELQTWKLSGTRVHKVTIDAALHMISARKDFLSAVKLEQGGESETLGPQDTAASDFVKRETSMSGTSGGWETLGTYVTSSGQWRLTSLTAMLLGANADRPTGSCQPLSVWGDRGEIGAWATGVVMLTNSLSTLRSITSNIGDLTKDILAGGVVSAAWNAQASEAAAQFFAAVRRKMELARSEPPDMLRRSSSIEQSDNEASSPQLKRSRARSRSRSPPPPPPPGSSGSGLDALTTTALNNSRETIGSVGRAFRLDAAEKALTEAGAENTPARAIALHNVCTLLVMMSQENQSSSRVKLFMETALFVFAAHTTGSNSKQVSDLMHMTRHGGQNLIYAGNVFWSQTMHEGRGFATRLANNPNLINLPGFIFMVLTEMSGSAIRGYDIAGSSAPKRKRKEHSD
jgi:hypothetical protein